MTKNTFLTIVAAAGIAISAQAENSTDVQFLGYVSYAEHWSGESGNNPLCGFYTYDAQENTFKQHTNNTWDIIARNGGVYAQGNVYAFGTAESWIFPNPQLYIYDYATWKLKHTISYGRDDKHAMADMTYDYTHNELLAVAYHAKNNSGNSYIYKIDTSTGDISEIAELDQTYTGMTTDAQGQLWALSMSGKLYRVERSGATQEIGSTGYIPQDDESTNSITFDYRTGRLYWAASVYEVTDKERRDIHRGLYEIDTKTGKATMLTAFPNYEKVTALSIVCPNTLDAPDNIADLRLRPIVGGTTQAQVTFTVPSKSYRQGNLAEGNLTAYISLDGTEIATEVAVPGTPFTYKVDVKTQGNHDVEVTLEDSKGAKGLTAKDTFYFGYDTPQKPQNVSLTFDADRQTATITWDAVTEGINKGEVDSKNLRYLITRYAPNEKEDVAADLKENTFTETITRDMARTRYSITAYDDTRESSPSYTEYAVLGQPQELPFATGINSWGDFNQFITIDANGDGTGEWETRSWYYDEQYQAAFCYLTYTSQDDWLITPALKFEAGKYYQVIFQTYGYYGYLNHLVVAAAPRAEEESFQHILGDYEYKQKMPDHFPYEPEEVLTISALFQAQDGDRYVGFHNISECNAGNWFSDHMSIDNIYIREVDESYYQGIENPTLVHSNEHTPVYDILGRSVDSAKLQHSIILSNGKKSLR